MQNEYLELPLAFSEGRMLPTAPSQEELLNGLPGEELILPGLADLQAGRESRGSLLIAIAKSRLRQAGLLIPIVPAAAVDPELRLYALLAQEHGLEAHGQYKALLARLDKFCRALEQTGAKG